MAALLPNSTITSTRATYNHPTDFSTAQRTVLTSGIWKFDWIPDAATYTTGTHVLMHFGTTGGEGIYFASGNPDDLVIGYPAGSGGSITIPNLAWTAGSTLHFHLDQPAGLITLSGFTSGNGTYGNGVARTWNTSLTVINVGDQNGGGFLTAGAYNLIHDNVSAGDLSITLSSDTATSSAGTVEVAGTSSVSLGSDTSSAAGTVSSTETFGSANISLAADTSSAAATIAVLGTSSTTLTDVSLSATGEAHMAGGPIDALLEVTLEGARSAARGMVIPFAPVTMQQPVPAPTEERSWYGMDGDGGEMLGPYKSNEVDSIARHVSRLNQSGLYKVMKYTPVGIVFVYYYLRGKKRFGGHTARMAAAKNMIPRL